MKRWKERIGTEMSKKRLGLIAGKVLFSRSRLGIKNIDRGEKGIELKLRIPSHDVIVVLEQDYQDPLARWTVKTVWPLSNFASNIS